MDSSDTLTAHLSLPPEFALKSLSYEWGGHFVLHPPVIEHVTLWETFEWQVWFSGCVLYNTKDHFHLCKQEVGWMASEIAQEDGVEGTPRFARDFRNPVLREILTPLLGLRGLAPLCSAVFRRRNGELRNDNGKIVCRFEWTELFGGAEARKPLARYARIQPLTGYHKEALAAFNTLQSHGVSVSQEGPLHVLLRHYEKHPRVYSLRPCFGLEEHLPARTAVGRIVRAILEIARENEAHIPGDVDTEFVHDYRICIRKIRSVLSLVKGVYPPAETEHIRKLLAQIARNTNRLRDLDVYLLAEGHYMELLPPDFREALSGVFDEFKEERAREIRRVRAWLKSRKYREQMEQLESFFSEDTFHEPTIHSDLPVGPLVFRSIYKRYRKIQAYAEELALCAPDETVHELRIEGKKLRYLIEFFTELIPQSRIDGTEKRLRRLQSLLGEFNDCSVQQKFLLDYWSAKPHHTAHRALALGGLVSVLYRRQQKQRPQIQAALSEFTSNTTVAVFKQVFKPQSSKRSADLAPNTVQ